jgi:hypothetical protein
MAERRHPLFRRGYSLGYAHRAQEEALADQEQHGPRSIREGRTTPPRSYDVTIGGLLDRLSPGVRADRDLIAMTDSAFTCETPCCGREITVLICQEDQANSSSPATNNDKLRRTGEGCHGRRAKKPTTPVRHRRAPTKTSMAAGLRINRCNGHEVSTSGGPRIVLYVVGVDRH